MSLFGTYLVEKMGGNWSWWWIPVIPALESLRQMNSEFKGSLGYVVSLGYRKRPCYGERQEKQTDRHRQTGGWTRMGYG